MYPKVEGNRLLGRLKAKRRSSIHKTGIEVWYLGAEKLERIVSLSALHTCYFLSCKCLEFAFIYYWGELGILQSPDPKGLECCHGDGFVTKSGTVDVRPKVCEKESLRGPSFSGRWGSVVLLQASKPEKAQLIPLLTIPLLLGGIW